MDAALHKILLNIYIWSKDITRKTIHHDILYDFSLLIDEIKEVDEQDTNIELLLSLSKILIESNLFGDYLYSSLPKHKKDIIHKNLGDLLIGKV